MAMISQKWLLENAKFKMGFWDFYHSRNKEDNEMKKSTSTIAVMLAVFFVASLSFAAALVLC